VPVHCCRYVKESCLASPVHSAETVYWNNDIYQEKLNLPTMIVSRNNAENRKKTLLKVVCFNVPFWIYLQCKVLSSCKCYNLAFVNCSKTDMGLWSRVTLQSTNKANIMGLKLIFIKRCANYFYQFGFLILKHSVHLKEDLRGREIWCHVVLAICVKSLLRLGVSQY